MHGSLQLYNGGARLALFDTNPLLASTLLFVGGLGDQFHAVPYLEPLWRALRQDQWSLAQVQLSSSGPRAWGRATIQQDAKELRQAITYLRQHGRKRIVLIGHSTGCQDIVRLFMDFDDAAQLVDGAILQAPVSDREAALLQVSAAQQAELVLLAEREVEAGRGDRAWSHDEAERLFPGAAITPRRFVSLNKPGADEDFFSSDLDDALLSRTFAPLHQTPTLFVLGDEDQYYPPHVDKAALLAKLKRACPSAVASSQVLSGANHNLSSEQATNAFVELVVSFLKEHIPPVPTPVEPITDPHLAVGR